MFTPASGLASLASAPEAALAGARRRLVAALETWPPASPSRSDETELRDAVQRYAVLARVSRVLPEALLAELRDLFLHPRHAREPAVAMRARWERAMQWAVLAYIHHDAGR